MGKRKYFWQGEQIKTEFGCCMVKTNKEKPLWWYNWNCRDEGHAFIDAIKITTKGGESFCISNEYGYGVHKLINGGWPNFGHASLPIEEFEMLKHKYHTQFDHELWVRDESMRRRWQEANFPVEFEKSESLSRLISHSKLTNKDLF